MRPGRRSPWSWRPPAEVPGLVVGRLYSQRGLGVQRHGFEQATAGLPAFRSGGALAVGGLQRGHQPQQFLDRTTDLHRIPAHRAHDALRVDHVGHACRRAVAGSGIDHAVAACDRHRRVFDHRESDRDPEARLDVAQPGQMREQAIDRQREQRAVQRVEAGLGAGEGDEFTGAHRGEIRRMREQQHPAAAVVLQREIALCGAGAECRRRLVQAQGRMGGRGGEVGHGRCAGPGRPTLKPRGQDVDVARTYLHTFAKYENVASPHLEPCHVAACRALDRQPGRAARRGARTGGADPGGRTPAPGGRVVLRRGHIHGESRGARSGQPGLRDRRQRARLRRAQRPHRRRVGAPPHRLRR
ncbi:hypothetical protein LUTEI9C_30121 [Luteimonas sp. 9C]|nr:hypothetical protein LUTEI9C_30121 [Luteimonas sp. 9C]